MGTSIKKKEQPHRREVMSSSHLSSIRVNLKARLNTLCVQNGHQSRSCQEASCYQYQQTVVAVSSRQGCRCPVPNDYHSSDACELSHATSRTSHMFQQRMQTINIYRRNYFEGINYSHQEIATDDG